MAPDASVMIESIEQHEAITSATSFDSEAFECNYDKNCTPLYKAIAEATTDTDYDSIIHYLSTGKWIGSYHHYSHNNNYDDDVEVIPPDDPPQLQVKTWVSRFHEKDTDQLLWSQLPLHLAIVSGAPCQLIAALVELYPQALRSTDAKFMLPLHLALHHGSDDEVIAYLLIQFPDAVTKKGSSNRSTIEYALYSPKEKLRGIILEIFTDKMCEKVSKTMTKEKMEIKTELDTRTSDLIATSAALGERMNELNELSVLVEDTDIQCKELIIENESLKNQLNENNDSNNNWSTKESQYLKQIERLKGDKLLQDVIAQKKIDQLLMILKTKDDEVKKARQNEMNMKQSFETLQKQLIDIESLSDLAVLKEDIIMMNDNELQRTRLVTKDVIQTLKNDIIENKFSWCSDDTNPIINKEIEIQINSLQKAERNAQTKDDVKNVMNDIETLTLNLKEREDINATKREIIDMKKNMESDLRHNYESMNDDDIQNLKNAISIIEYTNLENMTSNDLIELKSKVVDISTQLKHNELANVTKKEVEELKIDLENEILVTDNKTMKKELSDMKKSVVTLQTKFDNTETNGANGNGSSTRTDELISVKKEIEALKDEFNRVNETSKIRSEVNALKSMIELEIQTSGGKNKKELLEMKNTMNELKQKSLSTKDMDELAMLRGELQQVKTQLNEVEKISQTKQELNDLKKSLENEIALTRTKSEVGLQDLQGILMKLNTDHVNTEHFKKSLEDDIKIRSAKTEEELKELKKSINNIDVKKIEAKNASELDTVRKEIDVMKAYLNRVHKDSNGMIEEQIRSVKKTITSIDQIESKNRQDCISMRMEMDTIRAEIMRKQIEEDNLRKEVEYLKEQKQLQDDINNKKGLRKLLTKRFFNRRPSRNDKNVLPIVDEDTLDNNDNDKKDDEAAETQAELDSKKTFLPPRLQNQSMMDHIVDAVVNSDDDDSVMNSYCSSNDKVHVNNDLKDMLNKKKTTSTTTSTSTDVVTITTSNKLSSSASKLSKYKESMSQHLELLNNSRATASDIPLKQVKSDVVGKAFDIPLKHAKSDIGKFGTKSSSSSFKTIPLKATQSDLILKDLHTLHKTISFGTKEDMNSNKSLIRLQEKKIDMNEKQDVTTKDVKAKTIPAIKKKQSVLKKDNVLRKVRSLDPRNMTSHKPLRSKNRVDFQKLTEEEEVDDNSQVIIKDPVHFQNSESVSKPIVSDNGDVELHCFNEGDDDHDDDDTNTEIDSVKGRDGESDFMRSMKSVSFASEDEDTILLLHGKLNKNDSMTGLTV